MDSSNFLLIQFNCIGFFAIKVITILWIYVVLSKNLFLYEKIITVL